MNALQNDEEMKSWLEQNQGASVLLIWRQGQEDSLEKFRKLKFPRGWDVAALEINAAPIAAERLAVNESPAVAILFGDCLLAVEYGCDESCRERVVRWAQTQLREFLGA